MRIHTYLNFFQRLEQNPIVLQSAHILLQAMTEGHICLALPTLAQHLHLEWIVVRQHLLASILVGQAGGFAPLILDKDKLYIAKFWFEETQVAAQLGKRMQQLAIDVTQSRRVLALLFPNTQKNDWQKVGAAVAMLHPLTIISGSPGTGKTTTLTKLLVAILATQSPDLVIQLAAPTGKAAKRMQAAIFQAKSLIPEPFSSLLKHIPNEASTLHRLLKIKPLQSQYKKHNLNIDILVIDEASMIDLSTLHLLLASLNPHSRLILIGDHNQLGCIEPGAIFSSLCDTRGYSVSTAQQLKKMTGITLRSTPDPSCISDAVVCLQHSYRFSIDSQIAKLTKAIHQGNIAAVTKVLTESHDEIIWIQDQAQADAAMIKGYQRYFQAIQDPHISIHQIFALWEQFRILTPLRQGAVGSVALNIKISQMLTQDKTVTPSLLSYRNSGQLWYTGRPIIITENVPELGLYNGDIGIVRNMHDEMGVYFLDETNQVRRFPISRLPRHDTAFVLTVHKSQGSEFDEILCYFPESANAIMTRALLYTAVSRARKRIILYGQLTTLQNMLANIKQYETGLRERLAKPP